MATPVDRVAAAVVALLLLPCCPISMISDLIDRFGEESIRRLNRGDEIREVETKNNNAATVSTNPL